MEAPFDDEGLATETSLMQQECEEECLFFYQPAAALPAEVRSTIFTAEGELTLSRPKTVSFLVRGLERNPAAFTALDASRPWMVFWCSHGLDLLGIDLPRREDCVEWLLNCAQHPAGGFAGGPGQMAHTATTYSSLAALTILDPTALVRVNRTALYKYLLACKDRSGGFRSHPHGEVDARTTYTAVAAATMAQVATPELVEGTARFLASCQTQEGGFAGEPGIEAHGGTTYCAVAALALLGAMDEVHLGRLARWLSRRQMRLEGGFQGRTQKLVDGCYSFWQGGASSILERHLAGGQPVGLSDEPASGASEPREHHVMNGPRLQEYVLRCCQDERGGLRDKPSKPRDHYHTCYCLSGLSLAQRCASTGQVLEESLVGHAATVTLPRVEPTLNVRAEQAERAAAAVRKAVADGAMPRTHAELLAGGE